VPVGIYNDLRPDHIACASVSRQKFQILDRFQMLERRPEQERKILRPERKVPELERGFP
jgi:hypothetical protein